MEDSALEAQLRVFARECGFEFTVTPENGEWIAAFWLHDEATDTKTARRSARAPTRSLALDGLLKDVQPSPPTEP